MLFRSNLVCSSQLNGYIKRLLFLLQNKGHAVSRLLESFAADEGFRLDEESSFSEGEEEEPDHVLQMHRVPGKRAHTHTHTHSHTLRLQSVLILACSINHQCETFHIKARHAIVL